MNPTISKDMNVAPPAYIPIEKLIASGDFSYNTLAGCVNSVPYEPSYLGNKGIFHYQGVFTRTIELEFDGQAINLIGSSEPETPGLVITRARRSTAIFKAPRLAASFSVKPHEVAAIRELGGTDLESVETDATVKLRNAVRNIRTTWEYHRVKSIMGILLDADGSTLYNYFTALGVSQTTFDFAWATANVSVMDKAKRLLDAVEDALGSLTNPEGGSSAAVVPESTPLVICGRTFFEKLLTDTTFAQAFTYFQARDQRYIPTREDVRYVEFEFGGVRWRQYRGKAGGSALVPDAEAYVIIEDLPGTYEAYFTPPEDNMEAVNKIGIPITATAKVLDHNGGVEFRLQSNPLHVMTRPAAAIKCYSSN